jgi:hypothetical protein
MPVEHQAHDGETGPESAEPHREQIALAPRNDLASHVVSFFNA